LKISADEYIYSRKILKTPYNNNNSVETDNVDNTDEDENTDEESVIDNVKMR